MAIREIPLLNTLAAATSGVVDMTDEMKLLMAMCDALGFDVVVKSDRKRQPESTETVQSLHSLRRLTVAHGRYLVSKRSGVLARDDNGNHISELIEPIKTYTVSRRAV